MTRELLFLMSAAQAARFADLLGKANAGDGAAACTLGDMYREGTGGLRYSPKQTYHWYGRSALAGDANGQNNLGACYEHGIGCQQSYLKAVKWYRLAAARELGTASMNLGYCYLRGHGVPANRVEALKLLRLAVAQGEEKAADELDRLGEPVQVEEETVPGKHFGIVGAGGIVPPLPGHDEQIRRELLDVLTCGMDEAALQFEDTDDSREATDDELFPIYAESGMRPDDFLPETAKKYAAYLEERAQTER